MEDRNQSYRAHVLAIPYPTQGHINPMLQFCKRLVSKGCKATLAITTFISKTMQPKSETVQIDTISDGFDEGGFTQAESIHSYLEHLQDAGLKTLRELLNRQKNAGTPVDCIIYDSFLPWVVDITQEFGLVSAAFFTQPCAVNFVYYYVYHGLLTLLISSFPVSIPGLPLLDRLDMPAFIAFEGTYPAYFQLVLRQFLNIDKADYVLVNTFYKLEAEALDAMSKVCPLFTIGPTVPSVYLDNRVANDEEYGLDLFELDPSMSIKWLHSKPKGSVVFIAFGSMVTFDEKQMEELAMGLKQSNFYFLWVVRACEEAKLPRNFVQETREKGWLVRWSPQMKVLANEAIGCFFSHAGWNSSIEALSMGVPMVVMPQWTDQTTNAKLVQDVWKVGKRVKVDENGLVGREEVEGCVRQVMEGESGKEMKDNAIKWMNLAKEAVCENGTSDKCIHEFLSRWKV
nr:UDP-glycosyltransferase 74F2-like [Coffea arabica]